MAKPGEGETQTTSKWDEVLKDLTSDKIYKHFNENNNRGNNYDNDCKINGTNSISCTKFEDICKQFANNLEDILCNKHGGDTINYCILLKYWVYAKIKQNCNNNKNIEAFFLTEKLKNKVQCSIKNECAVKFECYDYYDDYMGDWEVEKDLYEYFINFDEINTRIKNKENGHEKYKECNPKYDPNVLLSMLGGSTETESSSKTDKHGIDISEQIGENDKYKYFDTYKPNETDVVIPNVRVGWHKSKNKSKSRIQNVRCLINYALKNSDYALVSCYNSEKGYRDYEHIFRPTKEEENFYSKLKKDKEKESHNRASSSLDYTNQFSIGTNKNGKGATKSNITPVMPAWMQGYSSLGEFIKGKKDEYTEEFKKSHMVAYTYAPTSRRHHGGGEGERKRIPCTYIKINEDKTIECVDKDKLNEIIIFKDIEGKNLSTVENDAIRTAIHKGQNLNTADNVDRSSATDSSTVESIDNFETTEDSIFKTPMFRGSTLAALLVGVVSVFFIYYKFTPFGRWIGRKDSKEKNRYMEMPIGGEQNVQNVYYGDSQRRNVPNRPAHAPNRSPKRPSSSSRKMDLPKERIRIAYHTS